MCQRRPICLCMVINLGSGLCGLGKRGQPGQLGILTMHTDGQGSMLKDLSESISIKTERPLVSILASAVTV